MPTSVPVPAAEMTQSPEHQAPEPHTATADAAEPAGRAPGLIRRARTAAKPASSTTALMTVMVLLATGLGTFVLRELNSIEADINKLETEVDARFVKLETEIDARFAAQDAKIDARFAAQDAKIDARFVKLETEIDNEFAEVDERFDALEAGQQEIALTLAALVAYLRADEGVDAALDAALSGGATGTVTNPAAPDPVTGP